MPSPPAVADERPLGWVDIGEVKAGGIDALLALDDGYLGWEAARDEGYPVAWYSTDGLTWTHTELAKEITPCPGWTARPDGEVTAGATNGTAAVLVGLEYAPGAARCGDWQATAWVTSDGTSWQRAPGFGDIGDGNTWSQDVWATPNGWEAGVIGPNGITIWRSPDGLTWTSVTEIATGTQVGFGVHASGGDGTRLLIVNDDATETSRLVTSTDGRDWHEIDGPPKTHGGIARILAPEGHSRPWIVVATDDEAETSAIWTSADLEHWDNAPFPMPTVRSIIDTTYGMLALGEDPCRDTGGPCDTEPSQYFLSPDGKSWRPLDAAVGPITFLEGRAGVVGIGGFDPKAEDGTRRVWRLERYSADEAVLFSGIRPDARFACSARRTGLPPRALAGVECSPQVKGVDRIGAYVFADKFDMLDAYFKRLADNGVKPRSGSCPESAGETSYVPGDDGAVTGPSRYGCYLNEFGNANYRFTVPDDRVYVGILGTGKDLQRLHDWAWHGNKDIPGSPTVWRAPSP